MFAHYTVEWYYNGDDEFITSQGFVHGDSMAEMAQKIDEAYGPVEAISLRFVSDDSNCLDFDDIQEFLAFNSAPSGAGPQVFEAIKQGLQEAIDGNYEEDLQE